MNRWIAIRNPSSRGQIELHNRRLYILPTKFGYIYAVMQLILLLAAINYSNSMTYVLTFLLTALGIISLWQTHKNLLGILVELKTPTPVFAGEQLHLEFILTNPMQAQRFAVGIQYHSAPPVYSKIGADQNTLLKLPLPALKRGIYQLDGFTIFTRYPTGLFHAWGWLKFDIPVMIYPKPQFDLRLKQSLAQQEQGKNTVDTVDGDDFAGLREHHQGESLRHISWKAYAQGRGMLTKTFHGHASPSLWIDWSDMPATAVEGKLSQMTALVLQAHQSGQHYGIRLPGITIEKSSGASHRADCLQQISRFRQSSENSVLSVDES